MIPFRRRRWNAAGLLVLGMPILVLFGSCSAEDAGVQAPVAVAAKEPTMNADAAPADAQTPQAAAGATGKTHPCAGAGRWFPDDPERLARLVDAYVGVEPPSLGAPPAALIVPHAGYTYSGAVAGKAFAALKGHAYGRVILIGLSHQMPIRGASVLRVDAYETPLGSIPVDSEARDAILKCPVVTEQPAAHRTEHSVENQLPLLQRAVKDFKMVEILVGDLTAAQRTDLADAIRRLVTDGTLLVVSTDFTHYGSNYGYVPFRDNVPKNLEMLNGMAVHRIVQIDLPGWEKHLAETRDTICGRNAIGLLLKIVEPWEDIRAARVAFDMSGRQTGDFTNSVTYASIAMWRGSQGLTAAEQRTLLALARDIVTQFLKTGKRPDVDPKKPDLTAALKADGAAFVTLKNAGRLRGCIGHIVAVGPLYQSIAENAFQACKDFRFVDNPITSAEVPALEIEISVLTPTRRLHDLEKIVIGRDGLIMARGRNRGVFLPQVPVEQKWDRTQYLTHLCGKAGLPPDAWKDPATELFRFSAQVFHEEKAPE